MSAATTGPLSDTQVGVELRKMTEFIKLEAQEKAREIQVKADQDFEKDKAALILQEKAVIDAAYDKKFKQAAMSQQITRSKATSKARIAMLTAGQRVVDGVFDDAEDKLAAGAKNKGRYQDVLKNLALEGFYGLGDPVVAVRARKQDLALAKKAVEAACAEYKEKVGKVIEASVDEERPLPEDCSGGLVIMGGDGQIAIDNTLDTRLELLKESALPAVRLALFGENLNRHFFD